MIKGLNRTENNVIDFFAHETYARYLCATGANFYSLPGQHVRRWDERKCPIPSNYVFSSPRVLKYIEPSVVLSQNPFVHIPLAVPIAKYYNTNVISIYHTEPPIGWNPKNFKDKFFSQCESVFITEENSITWTGEIKRVIKHGVDLDLFKPLEKENYVLSICNDWINRDPECGFSLWKYIKENTKADYKVFGDTPGFSHPCDNINHLADEMGKAAIFLNTTLRSVVPMTLMEAAAAGCAIVTTSTCAIPDFFNSDNAILFSPNKPEKAIQAIYELTNDKDYREHMGRKARECMQQYTIERFTNEWRKLLAGNF